MEKDQRQARAMHKIENRTLKQELEDQRDIVSVALDIGSAAAGNAAAGDVSSEALDDDLSCPAPQNASPSLRTMALPLPLTMKYVPESKFSRSSLCGI